MKELFENVSQDARNLAEAVWGLARVQKDPITAANFLSTATSYLENVLTEEEIEYLRFYVYTQLELMKE